MTRIFDIHDSDTSRNFTEQDLPLVIGSGEGAHVRITGGRPIEAYIGSADGYLFLQPAPGAASLLHNDSLVTASVWIKSGDTSRIGETLLRYEITGDRVEITAMPRDRRPEVAPPPIPHPDSVTAPRKDPLPRVTNPSTKTGSGLKLILPLLLVLTAVAVFVLLGRPVHISVTPQPDSLSLRGFPPAIPLGRNYFGLKGDYTLVARKKGFQELRHKVRISDDTAANSYSLTMKKLDGRLNLTTGEISGAHVLIDGRNIGITPLREVLVVPGEHRILIRRDRYLDFSTTINVIGRNQVQTFDFALEPAWSEVTLTSEPPGALVLVDGGIRGETPVTLELLTGERTLVLRKEKFSDHTMTLNVPAGKTLAPALIRLVPAPASLTLNSKPTGARVAADGVYQGVTPLTLQLSSTTSHQLVLTAEGYAPLKRSIELAPAQSRTVTLELEPEFGAVFLTSDPPDAELFIGGRPYGKGVGRFRLRTGSHVLELRAAGYKTIRKKITVTRGYGRKLDFRLEPKNTGAAGNENSAFSPPAKRELVRLEPARFQMGASRRDPGRRANERLRTVRITRPFYLGSREVTNREYRRFKPGHSSGSISGMSLDSDDQPVVNVSWNDAVLYLNWLSRQDGLPPFYVEKGGSMVPARPMTIGYRLPFEAEWSYAARYSGRRNPSRYPWDGIFPPLPGSGNFADESARAILGIVIQGYNDTYPVTAPVASFPKNLGGFFDMGGNVSEWCHDLYSPYSGFSGKTEVDPTGPETGTHHVVRDASWRDGSVTELRLSYRSYANQARDHIGFRVARFAEPPGKTEEKP